MFYGLPSMISPLDYTTGLYKFGYQIARIIRLKREEDLDPIAYQKKYADGFKMASDEEFLNGYNRATNDDNCMVYRRLVDPLFYTTLSYEFIFWTTILDQVCFHRSTQRNYVTTVDDHQSDLGAQLVHVDSIFLQKNIAKPGIRQFTHLCVIEQAYWALVSLSVTPQFVSRFEYLAAKIYDCNYTVKNPFSYTGEIDWKPYRTAIQSLNWRDLPGLHDLVVKGNLLLVLEHIMIEAVKMKTGSPDPSVNDYLYSPGSFTQQKIINDLDQIKDIPERLRCEFDKYIVKLSSPRLVALLSQYGSPFGITMETGVSYEHSDLLRQVYHLGRLLSMKQLRGIISA